jgi:hypothetical protein
MVPSLALPLVQSMTDGDAITPASVTLVHLLVPLRVIRGRVGPVIKTVIDCHIPSKHNSQRTQRIRFTK